MYLIEDNPHWGHIWKEKGSWKTTCFLGYLCLNVNTFNTELKKWSSHLLHNLRDCLICAPEHFQVCSTRFEPMTSAMVVQIWAEKDCPASVRIVSSIQLSTTVHKHLFHFYNPWTALVFREPAQRHLLGERLNYVQVSPIAFPFLFLLTLLFKETGLVSAHRSVLPEELDIS